MKRFLVLLSICITIGAGLPRVACAEDAVWRFELERMKRCITDGDYGEALTVAKTLQRECQVQRKRLSPAQFQMAWQKYEMIEVVSNLCVGTAERFSGNYSRAKVCMKKAVEKLQQIRARNATLYANAANLASTGRAQQIVGKVNDDVFLWIEGLRNEVVGEAVKSDVREIEVALLAGADGLATICIDSSLPLEKISLKHLREAEEYFRLAQEIRERNLFEASEAITIHGDHEATFLRNYGRLFLKLAEYKTLFPLSLPEERADELFRRARAYFTESEEVFSRYAGLVKSFRTHAHEGTLGDYKANLVRQIKDKHPEDSIRDIRDSVNRSLERLRMLALGEADLHFNQVELELAIVKASKTGDGVIPSIYVDKSSEGADDLTERLDMTEQRLLDSVDNLKMISTHGDHPFLILSYSQLVVVEALRAQLLGTTVDKDYENYLTQAETICENRKLGKATIESLALAEARCLWQEFGSLSEINAAVKE